MIRFLIYMCMYPEQQYTGVWLQESTTVSYPWQHLAVTEFLRLLSNVSPDLLYLYYCHHSGINFHFLQITPTNLNLLLSATFINNRYEFSPTRRRQCFASFSLSNGCVCVRFFLTESILFFSCIHDTYLGSVMANYYNSIYHCMEPNIRWQVSIFDTAQVCELNLLKARLLT